MRAKVFEPGDMLRLIRSTRILPDDQDGAVLYTAGSVFIVTHMTRAPSSCRLIDTEGRSHKWGSTYVRLMVDYFEKVQ